MTPREAIPVSVATRIRPIFITTMTTVLGLLPLVLFPGAGSELYRGLGAVVLGGLLVSTVFTLLLVPAVFILMMDLTTFVSGLLGTSSAGPIESEVPSPTSPPKRGREPSPVRSETR